jgi:uncharacterized membrane protein
MKEADLFNNPSTSKNIFLLSLLDLIYFTAFYLVNQLQLQHVMIGVFSELLTIPMILLELILIVVCIILLVRHQYSYRDYPGFSLLILCVTLMLWG